MTPREIKFEKLHTVHKLKKKLAATDYMAIKFAEGELSEAEYAEMRQQRREWRAEINAIQAEVEALGI